LCRFCARFVTSRDLDYLAIMYAVPEPANKALPKRITAGLNRRLAQVMVDTKSAARSKRTALSG
jgi:hypothetical protein